MADPTVERQPVGYPWRERFPQAAVVARGEDSAVYAAEESRAYWLIADEKSPVYPSDAEDPSRGVTLWRYGDRERWVADTVLWRQRDKRPDDREIVRTWPGPLDAALISWVDDVASAMEQVALKGGLTSVNERDHLQPVAAAAAHDLRQGLSSTPAVSTQMRIDFAHWPRLGQVDLALSWPDLPTALVELKCGHGRDALGHCVWDATKLAYAIREELGAGFLLAGARRKDWVKPVRGAELFADGGHELALLRVLYGDWWRHYQRRGDPQPSQLPRSFYTEHVHSASFTVDGAPWELRLAQVFSQSEEWLCWPKLDPS